MASGVRRLGVGVVAWLAGLLVVAPAQITCDSERQNQKNGAALRGNATQNQASGKPALVCNLSALAFIACPKRAAGDDVKNAVGDTLGGEAAVAVGVFHAFRVCGGASRAWRLQFLG